MTTLQTIELVTGPQGAAPRSTVIVLHGLGADGNDFVPVVDEMDLSWAGSVRFVFPHAPVRPVTINGGYSMRAWYDILGTDLVRREDEAGLRESREQIDALIEREAGRGVPKNRIVLMGFSQGCAMTLMTGLRHPERLAGLVGLSGYLPLAASTAAEAHEANRDVPIFLAHGLYDGVVPVGRAVETRDLLTGLGYAVSWHEYPMQHNVVPEEIAAIEGFLQSVLG
jgi:phospholipase/carboxylesterase